MYWLLDLLYFHPIFRHYIELFCFVMEYIRSHCKGIITSVKIKCIIEQLTCITFWNPMKAAWDIRRFLLRPCGGCIYPKRLTMLWQYVLGVGGNRTANPGSVDARVQLSYGQDRCNARILFKEKYTHLSVYRTQTLHLLWHTVVTITWLNTTLCFEIALCKSNVSWYVLHNAMCYIRDNEQLKWCWRFVVRPFPSTYTFKL